MTTLAQPSGQEGPQAGAPRAPVATPTRELEQRLIAPVLGKTEVVRLPGLPLLLDRALKATRESSEPGILAEWVALDPTLAARVIEATPGPQAASLRAEFRSLEARLATLDPELRRSMLVHAARCALGAERQSLTARELAGFWMHSLRCAFLSRALAERCAYRSPEEAYLAGLLHDFGSLALLIAVPNTFRSLAGDQAGADGTALPEHAGRLGTIHAQIGAALVERLQLPFYVADAVLLHHAPKAELEGTHLLVRILRSAETLSHPRVPLEQLRAVGELLGIGSNDISGAERSAVEAMNAVLRRLDLARPEPAAAPAGAPPASVVDMQRLSDTLVMRLVNEAAAAPEGELSAIAEPAAEASGVAEPQALAPGWEDALPSARGTLSSLFAQVANETARLEAQVMLRSANDVQSAVSAILPLSGIVTGLRRAVLFVATGEGDWPGWVVDAHGAARFDLGLATGVPRSVVARAAREAQAASSCEQARTTRLSGMDLQIARILGADEIAALPLPGEGPGCRGVLVFGTPAPRASGLVESLPLLAELARLVSGALAGRGARAAAAAEPEPQERMRATTKRLVHEARNPLTVLKTYLEIAKTRAAEGADLAKELQIASQEVERVAKLLDAIGQADGRAPEGAVAVDVNRTIEDLLLVYGDALFRSKGIALSTLLDRQLPALACDAEGLKQVLLNLLKNASEAGASGGQVLVSTSDRVSYEGRMMAEIAVADDGPGISRERMAGIFAAPEGAERPGGRGWGLSTSLAIVRTMGGHLACRSGPESGTTFSVLLPRGGEPDAQAGEA